MAPDTSASGPYETASVPVGNPLEPAPPATAELRALVENLTPGHMTPQDFYDACCAKAERTGQGVYQVAYQYALRAILDD